MLQRRQIGQTIRQERTLSTSKTKLRLLNSRALSLRLKIGTEFDIRISKGRAFQRGQIRTK